MNELFLVRSHTLPAIPPSAPLITTGNNTIESRGILLEASVRRVGKQRSCPKNRFLQSWVRRHGTFTAMLCQCLNTSGRPNGQTPGELQLELGRRPREHTSEIFYRVRPGSGLHQSRHRLGDLRLYGANLSKGNRFWISYCCRAFIQSGAHRPLWTRRALASVEPNVRYIRNFSNLWRMFF